MKASTKALWRQAKIAARSGIINPILPTMRPFPQGDIQFGANRLIDLIPDARNLALLVSPRDQMAGTFRNVERLGSEQVQNSDFHDFTIDYPSIGEPDPFYESNFSVDVDGWSAYAGTVVGNVDGIDGEDDVLKFYADSTDGSHYARRFNVITEAGQYYKITGKIYIPSTNTNLKSVRVMDTYAADGYVDITTQDSWVSFELEIHCSVDNIDLRFRGLDATPSYTWTGAGVDTDDIFYIKDIKVQRVGLVAWWQFDSYYHAQEGTGKTILQDLSGNGYDLTASAGFDWQNQLTGDDPTYKNGNALEFDGVDDYAYRNWQNLSPNDGNFSILFNIKTTVPDTCRIIFNVFDGLQYINIRLNTDGTIAFHIKDNSGYIIGRTTSNISDDHWHQIVFSYNSVDGIDLYIDGNFYSSSSQTFSDSISFTKNGRFGYGTFGCDYFDAYLSNFAIFNRALSATEVKALYGKPKGWTWNETGSISNDNFKAELSGGAELTQDITTDDETLYKEQKISTTSNDVDYFGNTTSHTITIDDGTWSYAGVKDVTNVDAVGSNFVEDFSKGGAIYGDEIATDSGFEEWTSSTNLTNWRENAVSSGVRDITQEPTIVHSGSYSVKMKATGNDGSLFDLAQYSDDVGKYLEIGALYKVSVWTYFKQKTSGYLQIQVRKEDWSFQTYFNISEQESGWTEHIKYFIATDDYFRFMVYFYDETDGEAYIDNFSVVKVSNGNHSLAQGGLETNQPVYPYAWEFDGVDDYIDFSFGTIDMFNTQWIFNFWAKATYTQNETIVGSKSGNRFQIRFDDNTRALEMILTDGTTTVRESYACEVVDKLHNFSIVNYRKDKTFDVYIDGKYATTFDFSTLAQNLPVMFYLGNWGAEYFNNLLSDFVWYLFDGQDGRLSKMPSNIEQYIKLLYERTKRIKDLER